MKIDGRLFIVFVMALTLMLVSVASSQGFTGLSKDKMTGSHNAISGLAAINTNGNVTTSNRAPSVMSILDKVLDQTSFKKPYQKPISENFNRDSESNYITWIDPKEHAFSLEVPRGWKITGGLVRLSSLDTRPIVEAISPDDKMRITIGDASIPRFMVPLTWDPGLGFGAVPHLGPKEGDTYTYLGETYLIKSYMNCVQFAEDYVAYVAKKEGFKDLNFLEKKALESNDDLDSGYIKFEYIKDGKLMEGYYYVGIKKNVAPLGTMTMWWVEYLFGYVAPASQEIFAKSIMNHMVGTYRQNSGFKAMQIATAASVSDIQESVYRDNTNINLQNYVNRQKSDEEISRIRTNEIRGVTDVVDMDTKETWTTKGGYNYYWRCGESISGTETSESPDINCRPLYPY